MQVPAEPDLVGRSTRSVKVVRADGAEASFYGYTYTSGALPGSGPEDWPWVGASLVLAALGLSWLTYRKLAAAEAATDLDLN